MILLIISLVCEIKIESEVKYCSENLMINQLNYWSFIWLFLVSDIKLVRTAAVFFFFHQLIWGEGVEFLRFSSRHQSWSTLISLINHQPKNTTLTQKPSCWIKPDQLSWYFQIRISETHMAVAKNTPSPSANPHPDPVQVDWQPPCGT